MPRSVEAQYSLPEVQGIPYAVEDTETQMMRAGARNFVIGSFPDYIRIAREDPHAFPTAMMQNAAKLGYLGMDTPEEYEGVEMTPMQ